MLHGSASRAAHRAAPGGLALLVRQATSGGQHRHPKTRPFLRPLTLPKLNPPALPGLSPAARPRLRPVALKEPERTMHLVMTGIGALIMLGICGLSSFFVIADERRGLGADDTGTAVVAESPYAISSQRLDPEPLSVAEVFSGAQIRLRKGDDPYRVTLTHIDTDCRSATTGAIGPLLATGGCTQVVRASMVAPYGGYQVTAGVFNLTDATAAARVDERVRRVVESGGGSFAAMSAGVAPGIDPLYRPGAQVGWRDHGHFLVYCVISRPDGATTSHDDPYARRITADLLDTYLSGEVIGARALRL